MCVGPVLQSENEDMVKFAKKWLQYPVEVANGKFSN